MLVIKGPIRSIAIEGVLTVSETVIGKVHVASFVGIQIDESLLWKDQIQCIDKCIIGAKFVCFLSYDTMYQGMFSCFCINALWN